MSFSFKYRKWRQEQHNSSTSHFCKSFRLLTVLTFPRDYKTWTPGVETQLNPSLIWLILVTGRGNHETKAAMGLNSRGNHVSGQSLKHESVSICPWLYPMVPAWKGKLQQLTVLLTNRNGGNTWAKLEKKGNMTWQIHLRLEEFFLHSHSSYVNNYQQNDRVLEHVLKKGSVLRRYLPVFFECKRNYFYCFKT